MGLIETNRRAIDSSPWVRRFASPVLFSLERALLSRLRSTARGALLDIGCGDMPYRPHVIGQLTTYDGLDLTPRNEDLRYIASAEDMAMVPTDRYDTILCTELLEHVGKPRSVVANMVRVLRPGGSAVVTVPFLGRLHEEPNDFFRYTRHGLERIFGEAGFIVDEITAFGSVGSFLGHQLATGVIGATWHLPVVKWVVYLLNLGFIVLPSLLIDLFLFPIREKLPLGYVLVATKPTGDLGAVGRRRHAEPSSGDEDV